METNKMKMTRDAENVLNLSKEMEILLREIGEPTTEKIKEFRTKINEIAVVCRKNIMCQSTKKESKEFAKGMSSYDVYTHLLYKVNTAPTYMHLMASVKLLMPILSDKLEEEML